MRPSIDRSVDAFTVIVQWFVLTALVSVAGVIWIFHLPSALAFPLPPAAVFTACRGPGDRLPVHRDVRVADTTVVPVERT